MLKRRRLRPQNVSLRVKVRERRRRGAGLLAALVFAAAGGSWAWRRAAPRLKGWAGPALTIASADAALVPEPARAPLLAELSALKGRPLGPLALGAVERGLRLKFPYLDRLRVQRSWTSRSLAASAVLKRAVAKAAPGERWLSSEGEIFEAPAGLYDAALPQLKAEAKPQAAAPSAEELRAFTAFLAQLPQGRFVREAAYEGSSGWSFRMADGLVLRWGALARTADKWARLDEVLADARGRYAGVLSANLRYFDDGRILIEPQEKTEPARGRAGKARQGARHAAAAAEQGAGRI